MSDSRRFSPEGWVLLLSGLLWLWMAPGHGVVGFVFSVVPGCLLLGSGVSMALMPGDMRISQFGAAGGVLGVLFALPAFFVVGFGEGFLLVLASAASFVASGYHTARLEPEAEDVPAPDGSLALAAQVACDEAILASMTLTAASLPSDAAPRIAREIEEARARFEAAGWLEKPVDYHLAPPDLEDPELRPASAGSLRYERLRFESGYEPREGEPGRERWLSYTANRNAYACVLRHPGPPRPWLVCIHGYQMGRPRIDLRAFKTDWLHGELGLNVLLPVLPLHGPRAMGRRSGDGFLAGDVLDTVHAEAQAMWDIRRMLGWIRSQGDGPVGVYGLSLGGYNTALLASLDDGLACAVAGIPATDFTRLFFRHGAPLQLREAEIHGIVEEHMNEVWRVISPLALECRVPPEGRAIFGGVADRLVPADQVRDLWRHWGEPRIAWYQGAHMTFGAHKAVGRLVEDTLRAGLVAA